MDSIRHRRLRFEPALTFPEQATRFQREHCRSKGALSWVIRSDLKPAPAGQGLCARRPARKMRTHSFSRTRRAILGNVAPSRSYRSR